MYQGRLLRFHLSLARACALPLLLAAAVSLAQAATTTISIGFDTDNNPATGCTLAAGSASMPGVEVVLDTVATTTATTGVVGAVTRRVCSGGVLGSPATISSGGWPIGMGAGTSGADVIETFLPLAQLPRSSAVRIGAITAGDSVIASASVVLPAKGPGGSSGTAGSVPIPALSPLALLLLTALVGATAWLLRRYARNGGRVLFMMCAVALTLTTASVWAIVRDGSPIDWTGIAPLAVDPAGDAPAGQDVTALFAVVDGANLSLRVDALLARDAAANQPPVVSAGTAQVVTLTPPATSITVALAGSASDDGLPNPPGALTLSWSKVSGPGTVTFAAPASAVTQATLGGAGVYVLQLKADDSALSTTSEVQITVNAPGNATPVVSAGPPQTVTLVPPATSIVVSLAGSASDDGLPNPPAALTLSWSKVSGPGTVTFANPSAAVTQVTLGGAGVYVLQLKADDSVLSTTATVSITVNAGGGGGNQPPTVNAGANQTITLPTTASLAGTATDDGLPVPPGALTTTWSLDSGPGTGVTFGNANALSTTATFTAAGTYLLRLTASDGAASPSSTMQVTVIDGAPLFAPIADQTIPLGSRFQLVLTAIDRNFADTLTYALIAAPAGAALAPSPLIDWTPTAAQLGVNTFTVQVTDANGHTATTTFRVTVTFTNTAPQLAPQNNQTVRIGNPFTRTLTAVDPDAGDVLTFALVAGPPGMTLASAHLNWPTTGRTPGDYAVTVRVTDTAGATDQTSFTVTLQQSAPPPVAKDDSYKVTVSQTLTVPPAGVLANDINPGGGALSAARLTDPVVGTLTAFNSDGSFTYQAPATPPGDPFTVAKLWTTGVGAPRYHELVADLNGDGNPDIISFDFAGIRAHSGLNGSLLWNLDNAGAADCVLSPGSNAMEHRVLADIDDSGHPSLVHATKCTREGSTWHDNIVAYDHLGTLKWVSPPLSKPHPDIRRGTTPVPPGGFTPGGLAYGRGVSVARLTAGGAPVLLLRAEIPVNDGFMSYTNAANQVRYAGCRAVTGLPADENVACRATLIISGANGSVLQTLVMRNPAASAHFGGPNALSEMPPIAMDIDGDGRVDLVSGTEVWMQNAGGGFDFAWQLDKSVSDTAVADLDGDGKAEIIHIRSSGEANVNDRGIFIYSHDGVFKRRIPLQTYWFTPLTIADVDGDGRSDIVLGADGTVYAFRDDGRPIWAYKVPADIPDNPVFAPFYTQPTQEFRLSSAAPQVYDLDGDGVAEVVVSGYSRVMILDGRTGLRKVDPYWNYSHSYADVSALMLIDMNNDGHVDIVQNAAFVFNCGFVGANFAAECASLLGPTAIRGGGGNNWLPGPKAWPSIQYRSTAVDDNARVLHDTTVSRIFRVPEQRGTIRDPRLAQAASFTYEASNSAGTSAPATVIIDIVPNNQPPVFTSIPPVSLWQHFGPNPPGGLVTHFYNLTAFDPDPGDTITFSLKQAPTWVTMSGPARIRFEPTCGSFGFPCPWGWTTVIVTATDSRGASTDQIFIVNLTTTSVTVPNVVGMLFDAAETALLAGGLQGVKWAEQFDLAPAGTVLAQEAAAGAVVGQFDTIRLTVSTGPQPVLMPFVIGMQLAPANSILTSAGLRVNVSTVFSTTIPAGEITAQSPAANTLLPATAPPVNLTVSAGGPLPAPIASIVLQPGPGPLAWLANTDLQFKAIAILTDGTSADVTLTAAWSTTNAAAATVDVTGFVKAKASGAATIAATLSGKTGQVTLNVAPLVPGDITPPTAAITSPADGADVTGPTPIVGTASDTNFLRYELAIALATDENYTVIAEGTTAVTNGTLGTFDPTLLENDLYTVRLTVFDRNENQSTTSVTVQAQGQQKVGLFTLSYTDLNLPSPGVPVTVSRTYDSRVKTQGDFGVGWRLGVQTLRLRTNRILGTGWDRIVSGPTVSLVPTAEHRISLTLSDGTVEQFDLVVSPTSNLGSLDFTRVTGLTPRAGTLGKLEYLGNPDLFIFSGGPTVVLVDDTTLDVFDPRRFRYTTLDGLAIDIDRIDGVKKVTDRNGNTVSYGPDGIVHSNGQSILFTRDAKGRIAQIVDPKGQAHAYGYDSNGDLVRVVDATGAESRYRYDYKHNLIEIIDPSGRGGVRSEYDAAGRLIAMIDAAGRRVAFAHNVGGNQDTITDRLGNVTRANYDGDGNVTRLETPVTIDGVLVNAVTTKSYDAYGNETAVTDPDGRRSSGTFDSLLPLTQVVDPAGLALTTRYAYNAGKNPTRLTDPAGKNYDLGYDARGNLISANLPLNGTSTATTNAQGLVTQRDDALGNRTTLGYDNRARLIREEVFQGTSTLLRRMEFGYDANGNRISETLHRTIDGVLTPLVTEYTYDAANRVVAVKDPAGNISRTEYDAAGRVTAQVDALGRRTTLTYDVLGLLERTTFPDGTFETLGYDPNGNVITQTDRGGRVTTHAYDELNRRVGTTLPGGGTRRTIYSAGGLETATIDERGNRTDYDYDAAGRLVKSTLPSVTNAATGTPVRPTLTRTLDATGMPVSSTDANGRSTTIAVDASGRPTLTTLPDGSTIRQTFDALGRRTSLVNEDNQAVNYGYDALGRLVSVQGLSGDATLSFDEAGNLVGQTDALGRTTRFKYDRVGRLIERVYPNGDTQRFNHDAVGNLVAVTDGLGRTTTFVYDAMNRLVRKSLPGGVVVTTTYHPDGQIATVTDARGITRYAYDARGRLASVTHPNGEIVAYTRGADDLLTRLVSPAGTIDYGYDALSRQMTVNAPEGNAVMAYDLAGNRLRTTAANGVTTEQVFDARNRPTSITHRAPAGAVLAAWGNTWSAAGRRTQATESGGSAETYSYDAKGRLTGHTRTGTTPFSASYAYDLVGNRTQVTFNGQTTNSNFDNNDRLISDGTNTYGYDANGNLVSRSGPGGATTYGYDAEDRLVTMFSPTTVTQYGYDAAGNRVQASVGAQVTRFLVDNGNPMGYAQVLEERNGGGSLEARYTYGASLLAMERGGNRSFNLRDSQGSVRRLTDAAGALTDTYTYDAYGNAVGVTGGTLNPYRYAGERLDSESGFYHLRARHYDPTTARFLSRDPFAGRLESPKSFHRYLYANADPVNFADPTGLESLIGLTVAQGISNTIKAAETASKTNQACNAFSTLGAVGYTVMATQLLYGALAASGLFGKFNSSFAVGGTNPATFKNEDLKSVQLRVAAGPKFSLNFSRHDKTAFSYSVEPEGPFTGSSAPIWSKSFFKCETIPVGSVQLKKSVKNWFGISFPSIPALSIEVELLQVIRNEWKFFDGYTFVPGVPSAY